MGKKLLSKDYNEIVFETLNIPLCDFENYYLNIVNQHYADNMDIIEKLKDAIKRGIEWYRNQRGHHIMWEVDENGNKTLYDQDKTGIPLYPHSKIYSHIDKSFFDLQIEKVQWIDDLIQHYNLQREHEQQLALEVVNAFNEISPFPTVFDIDKIIERNKALNTFLETDKENKTPTFESLFKEEYKSKKPDFVDILRDEKKGKYNEGNISILINPHNEWIGKVSKLAYIFYDCLVDKGIINKVKNIPTLSKIFINEFPNLPKDFATNGKEPNTYEEAYRNNFIERIEALKELKKT